jgi:hypothetical protein
LQPCWTSLASAKAAIGELAVILLEVIGIQAGCAPSSSPARVQIFRL